MQAAFPDIRNELADLSKEVGRLEISLTRHPDLNGLDEIEVWERTHALGSATEKMYSGCERVMSRIAVEVDGQPVAHSDGWHISLLKRMSHPIDHLRGPVVGPELYSKLDRLRSFRHRERNSYGIDLNPDIVLERAYEAVETFDTFRLEVERFLDHHTPEPDATQEGPTSRHP